MISGSCGWQPTLPHFVSLSVLEIKFLLAGSSAFSLLLAARGALSACPDDAAAPLAFQEELLEPPLPFPFPAPGCQRQSDGRMGSLRSGTPLSPRGATIQHPCSGGRHGSLWCLRTDRCLLQGAWLETSFHCIIGVGSWALKSHLVLFFILSVCYHENVVFLVTGPAPHLFPGTGHPVIAWTLIDKSGRPHLWQSRAWPGRVFMEGRGADLSQKRPLAPPAFSRYSAPPPSFDSVSSPVRVAGLWDGAWRGWALTAD